MTESQTFLQPKFLKIVLIILLHSCIYHLSASQGNLAIPSFQKSEDISKNENKNTIEPVLEHLQFNSTGGPPCNSHFTCSECYSSSKTCHWCSSDNQCHAKGSIHGCTVGASCEAKNSSNNDNSCHSHTNCTDCYDSSYGCHWCASDNQCHAKGSIHGCSIGASCQNATDNSCRSHNNCTECSLSSYGCHWCEFDNQCHAKGSVYGCAVGVDCYSNDRCQRQIPEKIHTPLSISPLIDLILWGSLIASISCCTFCFCGVRGIKETVNDLRNFSHQRPNQLGEESEMTTPLLWRQKQNRNEVQEDSQVELSSFEPLKDDCEQNETIVGSNDDNEEQVENEENETPLSPIDSNLDLSTEPLLPHNEVSNQSNPTPSIQYTPSNMLYTTCKTFYIVSILVMIGFTLLVALYFPRMPIIDVCSNEMEWKSIIDGLVSLKVEASFQILVSIYNANRISVNLQSLSGSITHDGDYIGRYEILPNTMIEAQSITDIQATVTVTPDKWEALELTSEYYKGTLAVMLDCHASAQIPIIPEYTYGYSSSGIMIHLDGAAGPREYCACPQWQKKANDPPEFMSINLNDDFQLLME